jgi:hypothetical protein
MRRGEKLVTFKVDGPVFNYRQPGWWCPLDDPDHHEGHLVDDDNRVAEMARRSRGRCSIAKPESTSSRCTKGGASHAAITLSRGAAR